MIKEIFRFRLVKQWHIYPENYCYKKVQQLKKHKKT